MLVKINLFTVKVKLKIYNISENLWIDFRFGRWTGTYPALWQNVACDQWQMLHVPQMLINVYILVGCFYRIESYICEFVYIKHLYHYMFYLKVSTLKMHTKLNANDDLATLIETLLFFFTNENPKCTSTTMNYMIDRVWDEPDMLICYGTLTYTECANFWWICNTCTFQPNIIFCLPPPFFRVLPLLPKSWRKWTIRMYSSLFQRRLIVAYRTLNIHHIPQFQNWGTSVT